MTPKEIKIRKAAEAASLSRMGTAILDGNRVGVTWLPVGSNDLGYTCEKPCITYVAWEHKLFKDLADDKKTAFRMGVFAHELLHRCLTNFAYTNKICKTMTQAKASIFMEFANTLEDPAIEFLAPSVFGGSLLEALKYSIRTIYVNSPAIGNEPNAFSQLINALIQFGDMGLIKGKFTFPEAKEYFKKVAPLYNKGIECPDSKKRLEIAKECMDICKPLWEEAVKQEEFMEELIKNLHESLKKNGVPTMDNVKMPKKDERSKRRSSLSEKLEEEMKKKEDATDDDESVDNTSASSGESSEDDSEEKTSSGGNDESQEKEPSESAKDSDDKSSGSSAKDEATDGDASDNEETSDKEDNSESEDGTDENGSSTSLKNESSEEDTSDDKDSSNKTGAADSDNEAGENNSATGDESSSEKNSDNSSSSADDYSKSDKGRDILDDYCHEEDEANEEAFEDVDVDEKALEDIKKTIEKEIKDTFLEEKAKKEVEIIPDYSVSTSAKSVRCYNGLAPSYPSISDAYSSLMSEYSWDIKCLTKSLNKVLESDRDEMSRATSGSYNIKRGSIGTSARIFDKRREKGNKKDAAVVLAVDLSGSMSGPKIIAARKAAIVFAESLTALKIPYYIMGFSADTRGYSTYHNHYVTWSNKKCDRERLAGMAAGGNNFDGYSIRYAAELLKNNNAANKTLFVISDGFPHCNSYHSLSQGIADTINAIKESRKYATVFGIALGQDCGPKLLQQMYGKDFIHCPETNLLTQTLCKQLEKVFK